MFRSFGLSVPGILLIAAFVLARTPDAFSEDELPDSATLEQNYTEEELDAETDSTPAYETQSTLDLASEEQAAGREGWTVVGDLRPILAHADIERGSDQLLRDEDVGLRARLNVSRQLSESVRIGAGLAGRCTSSACNLNWVMQPEIPGPNGLENGDITADELYLQWQHRRRPLSVVAGRFQSRFVLRGGVYAKSMDHNDSNNVRITWTDGLHAAYRVGGGWRGHAVVQYNSQDGTGSIRRGPLNFEDSGARASYVAAFENRRAWGPLVQRGLTVSYLPSSLLPDNDPAGAREDYWGIVGRLAVRWPQRSTGLRFRGGVELAYAPNTPRHTALGIEREGDTKGVAWNVVANAMDIRPGHSIGINYGETEAGWLLSPQFLPNSRLAEVRYQWQPNKGPLFEARLRRQTQLEPNAEFSEKLEEYDVYFRLTWEFGL